MFLKTYLDVPVTLASFKATFSWEPERCFAGLDERAREEGELLLAEAGLTAANGADPDGGPPRRARLHLGQVLVDDQLLSVPVELEVLGTGAFPSLQGTIDAAWLGPDRSYLSLGMQYEMPAEFNEQSARRTVYHRVIEVVVHHFLANVSTCLCVSCAANARPAVTRAELGS